MKTLQITDNTSKILAGINIAADIIKSTMGAGGKLVAINDSLKGLRFTKDGVSVSESIVLQDPVENIGAQLLISSASKTVEQCGDGTTATSVLLQAMVNTNPDLEDLDLVISKIKEKSNALTTIKEVKNIATVSSNSERLGELVAKVYDEVGLDSLVTLEQTEDPETSFEIEKGYSFNSGYISVTFANQPNKDCIFQDPIIIIDPEKTSDHTRYVEYLQTAAKLNQPLVIISPEFSATVKRTVVENVKKGLPVCLVKAPGIGKQVLENFKDIYAIAKPKEVNAPFTVSKAIIKPNEFILFNENDMSDRIQELKDSLKGFVEDYDIMRINRRIHSLQSSTAVIYSGGLTPESMKEEYDRLEDALGAVQTAIESGYVLGGGYALKEASKGTKMAELGKAPYFTILENAGYSDVDLNDGLQFNVKSKEYENFLVSGIIDPTDVVIQSLLNASSSYNLFNKTKYSLINETTQFQSFGR